MLYEELMMDSVTLTKFNLFKRLVMSPMTSNYPITRLSKELSLNYQKTAAAVNELNKDLLYLHNEQTSLLKKPGRVNTTDLLVSIDDYRYFLLEQSIPFQYLLYILNHSNPTIEDFCHRHFVSRSTFSRKMAALKSYLKEFDLRFTYTDASLVGDERVVRATLFNLIWLGTRGAIWPFTVAQTKCLEITNAFSTYFPLAKTYLGQLELSYLVAVSLSRMKRKFFATYDNRYNLLMEDNPYYDFTLLEKMIDTPFYLTKEQLKGESGQLFFLAHYAPFYTLEDQAALQQTLDDFSNKPNVIESFVEGFLAQAKKTIFVNPAASTDFLMIKGNLLNLTFTHYVLRQTSPTFQSLIAVSTTKSKTAVFLEEQIEAYFDLQEQDPAYQFIQPAKKQMIRFFLNILLPYYEGPDYAEHLKIGIAFEHNFLLVKRMYHFLDYLGFVETSPYREEENDDYDLVLSSSLLPRKKYPDLPVYFWDLTNDDMAFADLYKVLLKLVIEKNTLK